MSQGIAFSKKRGGVRFAAHAGSTLRIPSQRTPCRCVGSLANRRAATQSTSCVLNNEYAAALDEPFEAHSLAIYKQQAAMDTKLRQSAEERLKTGAAPPARGAPIGTSALALLHRLASVPTTASDALKLLHEMQVHQVELDLQCEQAEQDCRQLSDDLTHFTELFDLAPFAYLCLDTEGVVIAANRRAADWLVPEDGTAQAWAGHRIEDLLAPECRAAVQGLLAALRETEGPQTCAVQAKAGGATAHAVATATAGSGQVLMALLPAGH